MNALVSSSYSDYAAKISSYLPKIASSEQIGRNLKTIAMPALAFFAESMVQETRAIGYVECIDNCDEHRDAHPLAKLICYVLSAIFVKN